MGEIIRRKEFGVLNRIEKQEGEKKEKLPPPYEIYKKEMLNEIWNREKREAKEEIFYDINKHERENIEDIKRTLINAKIGKKILGMSKKEIEKLPLEPTLKAFDGMYSCFFALQGKLVDMRAEKEIKGELLPEETYREILEKMEDSVKKAMWLAENITKEKSLAEEVKTTAEIEKKDWEEIKKTMEATKKDWNKKNYKNVENSLISCYSWIEELFEHVVRSDKVFTGENYEKQEKEAIERILGKGRLKEIEEMSIKKAKKMSEMLKREREKKIG